MPRNKLIEDLHAALYDALTEIDPVRKAELELKYSALHREVCARLSCTATELRDSLQGDFGKWRRDEGLPPPSR